MRYLLITISLLVLPIMSAKAQMEVDIDVEMREFPRLVPIPGYPVYYDPDADANYFFYDGLYWVFWDENWYASSWYNGPWQFVEPLEVPLFVLRVPVRYYRRPPEFFMGWREDELPHWEKRWGHDWEEHRRGWDHWDRRSIPPPAPLPTYQHTYTGERYPQTTEERHSIRSEHYHYQPHDPVARQHFQPQHGSNGFINVEPRQEEHHEQHTQPSRPMHETQPMQPKPEIQQPKPSPHENGRENHAAPPEKGSHRKENEEHSQEHR